MPTVENSLLGVVLCGGESTRMGTDKGLLKEADITWAELAASKLETLHLPVVVSVNKQQPAYQTLFPKERLVIDRDDLPLKGPLLGLLSVHLQFPGTDLFVLACDMKDMRTTLLEGLREEYLLKTHEAYVYSTPEKHQPLCGIYTAHALKKINGLFEAKQLKRHSMMAVLETLNTKFVSIKAEDLPAFTNYNSPAVI